MKRSIAGVAMWLIATTAAANLAHAQVAERQGSSFAIIAQPVDDTAIITARPNRAFFTFNVRPVTSVTLQDAVPPEIATQFGAKTDVPFVPGLQLHGLPERPGLYCDLLRARGLGLSGACLRDIDGDGRFDEGLRLDFNSASGDVLLLTPSAKIIGVRFKAKPIALPTPVRYTAVRAAPNVTGKLSLRWNKGPRRADGIEGAEVWISTPDNYTGTEGLSQRILSFPRAAAPLDVELYGIKLHIAGFDEHGAMQVSVRAMAEGEVVPLLFRGYVIYMIGY